MSATHMATMERQPAIDREALRAELEATRAVFHDHLNAVSGEHWRQKCPGSDWSVAEVFVHLVWAIEYLPKEIEAARQGKGMFNMPKWLADPLSYWMIRFMARGCTPSSLQERYDAAIAATLEQLETLPDSDWSLGADFYGHGFYTVADLFHTPAEHLTEHTAGL